MNKFLPTPQKFELIREIIENKSRHTNVVDALIYSSENVANEEQMFELLRLIKFNIHDEEKELIVCLDNYILKYSYSVLGFMKFEICYEENQSNLHCPDNENDVHIIIMHMVKLFNETPPEKRNNQNCKLMVQLYKTYISK